MCWPTVSMFSSFNKFSEHKRIFLLHFAEPNLIEHNFEIWFLGFGLVSIFSCPFVPFFQGLWCVFSLGHQQVSPRVFLLKPSFPPLGKSRFHVGLCGEMGNGLSVPSSPPLLLQYGPPSAMSACAFSAPDDYDFVIQQLTHHRLLLLLFFKKKRREYNNKRTYNVCFCMCDEI